MLTDRELSAAVGSTAYDPAGDSIGTVEHFFVDDRTGAPTWVAVSTGLFGTRHSIVPALDATFDEGTLRLPVSKAAVRSAPHVGDDQHLDPDEETELRRHYGLPEPADAAVPPVPPTAPPVPPRSPAATAETTVPAAASREPATSAPSASDGAMTRSEERLRISTEPVAATRVRLVKYIVTEEVQVTVPVRREEIRIEEVPLDAADPGPDPGESLVPSRQHAAADGTASPDMAADTGTGLPEEIVLHREEPVVGVRVVPAERVRLRTEVVQGQERVGARLQRERIAVDNDPAVRRS